MHVEDIFSILQARGSMLRTTAHHERALQVRPISSPTILFFGDANLGFSTSGGMLARPYFEPKFEPYFPSATKKHNVTVRGKCVIYTSEANGVKCFCSFFTFI